MSFFERDPVYSVGQRVEFEAKVFKQPYSPYYNDYKDQMFEVVALHYENTHVELKCITDPTIFVDGFVHPDELRRV